MVLHCTSVTGQQCRHFPCIIKFRDWKHQHPTLIPTADISCLLVSLGIQADDCDDCDLPSHSRLVFVTCRLFPRLQWHSCYPGHAVHILLDDLTGIIVMPTLTVNGCSPVIACCWITNSNAPFFLLVSLILKSIQCNTY